MEMRFDIGHQSSEAFTRMIAGAQVMHITTGALEGVRARAIGRQPEQGEPRVGGQPLLNGLRVMNGRGFCRKVRFLGEIQKSGVRNSMTYRLPNSRKNNFATEPQPLLTLP